MNTGEKIKGLRVQRKLTQEQVGNYLGLQKSVIAKYEKGLIKNIKSSTIEKMAELFNVSPTYFFDFDEQSKKSIPVLGRVQAGVPTSAVEDIIGWEELSPDMVESQHEFFGLKVKGDSMSPIFLEGDVVIIKCQNDCENGQDCVVVVGDDEATLKRVFKKPTHIILQPLNREYAPIIIDYTGDVQRVKIIGVVAELRRRF